MKTFASQLSHLIATDYVPWPFRDKFQQAILYVRHSVKSLMFSLDTSHGTLWNLMEESQLLNLGAQSTARPLPRAHVAHT